MFPVLYSPNEPVPLYFLDPDPDPGGISVRIQNTAVFLGANKVFIFPF